MAITYAWLNAANTHLQSTDDSTTPDTVDEFFTTPADSTEMVAYLAWVAQGNTATAYVAPGYETTASAKTTRSGEILARATAKIESLYGHEIKRSQLDSGYELSSTIQDAIKTIYATSDASIAAVEAAADVSAVEAIDASDAELAAGEFDDGGTTETVDVTNSGVAPTTGVGAAISAYAAFDGSAGGSFDWTTDTFASFGVSSITRVSEGKYTINFETSYASANYCVICTAGDEDHSGTGASPRCVNVLTRTASAVTILVERSDDGAQDDEGYIAMMVMGTLAS